MGGKGMRIKLVVVLTCFFWLAGVIAPESSAASPSQCSWHIPGTHPIIFVHGGAGSGSQFESQAMRFMTNFYPAEFIHVHEYDSRFGVETMDQVLARLDQFIADVKEKTGADQVDILGHSLGTMLMHNYLASPERAANVAHYVNIDGRTSTEPPGGVPTLAIWAGRGSSSREIGGATNVTIPDQTHVQVATSAESFVEMYRFFTGFDPMTKYVLPEFSPRIELAGRAVIFPQNIGVPDASLEVWEVNGRTGERIGRHPKEVYILGEDGSFGPFEGKMGRHYEFNIVREGYSSHPFYYEPFIRSDYFIRLLSSTEPDGGVSGYMDRSDDHVNLIISRNMELWGDQGDENDSLEINGINVISEATNPITKLINAMFVYDQGADGENNLGVAIPYYESLTFFTGVDLYIPGSYPPDGTTSIVLTSRVGGGMTQTINVPNLASSEVRRITLQFNDFVQPWP